MTVHVGALRDRVRIQARTRTRTSTGDIETWADTESRWCRVIPIAIVPIRFRSDFTQYQQDLSRATYKIIFRGFLKLSFGDTRILWDSIGWDGTGERIVIIPIREEIMRGGSSRNFTTVFCREDPDEDYPDDPLS
jgi:hypothetical protein